jgi:hypothetical protein
MAGLEKALFNLKVSIVLERSDRYSTDRPAVYGEATQPAGSKGKQR